MPGRRQVTSLWEDPGFACSRAAPRGSAGHVEHACPAEPGTKGLATEVVSVGSCASSECEATRGGHQADGAGPWLGSLPVCLKSPGQHQAPGSREAPGLPL